MMAAVTDLMQRVEPFVEADVAAIIQGITGAYRPPAFAAHARIRDTHRRRCLPL